MAEKGKKFKIGIGMFVLVLVIGLTLADCQNPTKAPGVQPPSAPTGLVSAGQAETTIALTWNPVDGALNYHVYTGSAPGNLALHSSTDSTSCLLSSLTPNTTYYIAVSAENEAGEGDRSQPIAVKTSRPLPPAPTGLVSITHTETTIALAWDHVDGASMYHVYTGTVSGDLTLHSSYNATFCLLSSLTPNVTYYIEVSAENESGEGDKSLPITVTTNDSVKPAAPSGLKADTETITVNSIAVSWNEVAGVLSYKIFAGTVQTALTLRGTSDATEFEITGLNPNTAYYISVAAITATNESDQCVPINVTTKPPAPSGLTAGTVTQNSITVSWTAMNGISRYIVYAGTSSENMTQRGTPIGASFSITTLNPNTEYYIAVSAQNVSGEGGQTSPLRATTLLTAPSGLTAEPIQPSTIRLSWNAVSGAASYKIYRSTSSASGFTNIDTVTSTTYNDTGRPLSTMYYYRVSAVSSASVEGVQSSTVSARIPSQAKTITQFRIGDFSVNGTISGTNINITVPNIVNLTTLVPTITHNGVSVSPASGVAMDFSSPRQYTVTAEDNSIQTYSVTVTPSNITLAAAITWINSNNARSNTTYTIVATANESMGPTTIDPWYSSININLSGGTTERTISLNSNGSLFTIERVTLTLGNNITLQGRSDNNASLVLLSGGNIVMNAGSKIINNTILAANNSNADGGAVNVRSGTFTMNGGTISGNRVQAGTSGSYVDTVRARGGGVYVGQNGRFTMNGGTISNNTAYSAYYASAGGGVFVAEGWGEFTFANGTISDNTAESTAQLSSPYAYGGGIAVLGAWSTFTMQGGTISGNRAYASATATAFSYGGGVYVRNDSFTKTGGTIHGSNATEAQRNTAADNNSAANTNGHAAYALVSSTILRRNNTAGTSVSLDSSRTGSAGGWE